MIEGAQSRFVILDGLPSYGPPALPFSSTGQGKHREGFVVRFCPANAEEWVGNFQPGLSSFHKVLVHPNQMHLIVVAGGEAYVVDPTTHELVANFGGSIEAAVEVLSLKAVLFSNGLWFELLGQNGLNWKTRRLSWDGMRNVQVLSTTVVGEGWCFDETWHKFSVDLSDGKASGGGYNGPEP